MKKDSFRNVICKKNFMMFRIVLLLLCFIIAFRVHVRFFSHNLRITFLDVGQGDSALIEFPKGKTMLIDAGRGTQKNEERIITKELARKGILTLDIGFLSHPDWDHGFGFLGIFKNISIKEFWMGFLGTNKLIENINANIKERKILVRNFLQNEIIELNGVTIKIIPITKFKNNNNQSLILVMEFKGCKAIFSGDIEKEGEHSILNILDSKVTILKAPHHGSKSSSSIAFIKKLLPIYTVISAGSNNKYGHPNATVVRNYKRFGSNILRTDFHGYIEFTISPKGIMTCQNYYGSCGTFRCGN